MASDEILVMEINPKNPVVLYHAIKNDLSTLQGRLDGFLEPIHLTANMVMLVDEDGNMKNLPRNPLASMFVYMKTDHVYQVCGRAIVLGSDPPDFTDCPKNAWVTLYEVMAELEREANE
jgi:hypothetical protein